MRLFRYLVFFVVTLVILGCNKPSNQDSGSDSGTITTAPGPAKSKKPRLVEP